MKANKSKEKRVSIVSKTSATLTNHIPPQVKALLHKIGYSLAMVAWVIASFYGAQFIVLGLVVGFSKLPITVPVDMNETVFTTVITGVVYILALALAILVPQRFFKKRTTRDELGLRQSLPQWRDLGLAPLVYIACFISTAITIVLLEATVPAFDAMQRQEIPFDPSTYLAQYELILVFVTLGVIAPVFEELLLRGYLYGKLRKRLPAAVTILVTAIVFSALHLGIGQLDSLQWNVAVDTFILAIGLGLLRHYTNSVWAGIVVHMIKNTIAFFILFVLPRFLPMADLIN